MNAERRLEMLARKQAIQDIKEELKRENKHILMFRKELNPTMRQLVREHYQR